MRNFFVDYFTIRRNFCTRKMTVYTEKTTVETKDIALHTETRMIKV